MPHPLIIWIHGQPVSFRVSAVNPPSTEAAVKLVAGTEVYVAPRLRPKALQQNGNPDDISLKRKETEEEDVGINKKVITFLRVLVSHSPMRINDDSHNITSTNDKISPTDHQSKQPTHQHTLQPHDDSFERESPPTRWPMLNYGFVNPWTLNQTGLRDGDWVAITTAADTSSKSSTRGPIISSVQQSGPTMTSPSFKVCVRALPMLTPEASLDSESSPAITRDSVYNETGSLPWPPPPGYIILDRVTCSQLTIQQCDPVKIQKISQKERDDFLSSTLHTVLTGMQPAFLVEPPMDPKTGLVHQKIPAMKQPSTGNNTVSLHDRPHAAVHSALLSLEGLSCKRAISEILSKLLPVLAAGPRSIMQSWGAPRPGSVLLEGTPGSGKSTLMHAISVVVSTYPECLAHVEFLCCRDVQNDKEGKEKIEKCIMHCMKRLPALIILDDIDVLCPAGGLIAHDDPAHPMHDGQGREQGGLVGWLCDMMDGLVCADERWVPHGRDPGSHRNTHEEESHGIKAGTACEGAWAPLAIIATCQEAARVSPALREIGRFESVVTLEPPSSSSRAAMLSNVLRCRGWTARAKDIESIASLTDGFNGRDLGVLVERAFGIALTRQLKVSVGLKTEATSSVPLGNSNGDAEMEEETLNEARIRKNARNSAADEIEYDTTSNGRHRLTFDDMKSALHGLTPAAFWGVDAHKAIQSGIEGWQDVGGLSEVRAVLKEVLELPLKHPALVAKAPLRLRTGVLLYGPPGCGKTHVVAAAVAAAGVRCITVSGPELLNKYIGASEAAVRDVFRRAAAAAPSVLFFDEFDAIAPQRGHDNTGVSDRVVNQLLTELDGVEGLRGVAVVAATSRPDLIDVALLRPGRLDRLLYCGFPLPMERRDIFGALSRRLTFSDDVNMDLLADEADGLSGADLGAVLSEAQLMAAHEALERETAHGSDRGGGSGYSGAAGSYGGLLIRQDHLIKALHASRPSVSAMERARLERIYGQFEGKSGVFDRDVDVDERGKGKKVSWA